MSPVLDAAGRPEAPASSPPADDGSTEGPRGPDRSTGPPLTGLDGLSQAWPFVLAAGRVLVPGTLLASLFFYFGLRYTHDHYLQYGLDDGGLGFSTTDYAVRSLNVTVEPARTVAIAAIAAVGLHMALAVALRWADRTRPPAGTRWAGLLGAVCVVAGVVGMALFWSPGRLDVDPVTSSGWWLVSVLAVMYGLYLGWARPRPGGRTGRSSFLSEALAPTEARVVGSLLLALALVLVAHGAFELTRAYARDRAIQQALQNEAQPWTFPLVRVYSDVDLALDDNLGVAEEVLRGDASAYRYRYGELRLFLHQDDRLVLWPTDRSPRSGMFILRESDGLRIEYAPELR